jgi:uncharacterized C2H2 Zn-finger protein
MNTEIFKTKVNCPKCKNVFEINIEYFNINNFLTCTKCGNVFSIEDTLLKTIESTISQVKAELKKRLKKAEKGIIKLSSKEVDDIKKVLKKNDF